MPVWVHTPPWQASVVQALASAVQAVPFATLTPPWQAPVDGLQVPATAMHSPTAQETVVAPSTQAPAPLQVSFSVQRSALVQAAPAALGGLEQTPVAGLQTPASKHCPEAVQTVPAPGAQVPAAQTSPVVQALASEQDVPFAAFGFEQPVAGLHIPATWH
jgi:hypothetical protein